MHYNLIASIVLSIFVCSLNTFAAVTAENFCASLLEPSFEQRAGRAKHLADPPSGPDIFMGEIASEVLPNFNTIRLFHREGRIPTHSFRPGHENEKAKARVVFLHGFGASISESATTRGPLINFVRTVPRERRPGKKPSVINLLLEYKNYVRVGAESIDLPFHGVGPHDEVLWTPAVAATWLGEFLLKTKSEAPELPLFVVARSASPALLSLAFENPKYRDIIAGVVFINPTAPGEADLIQQSIDEVHRLASTGQYGAVNHVGLEWARQMLMSSSWRDTNFGGLPTLIMTGDRDGQMSNTERALYSELALKNMNIEHIRIADGEHDLLSVHHGHNRDRRASIESYQHVYDFLTKVLGSQK